MESRSNRKNGGTAVTTAFMHDTALKKQIVASPKDATELYKKYTEDQAFQENLNHLIFTLTYPPGKES